MQKISTLRVLSEILNVGIRKYVALTYMYLASKIKYWEEYSAK